MTELAYSYVSIYSNTCCLLAVYTHFIVLYNATLKLTLLYTSYLLNVNKAEDIKKHRTERATN